jgi:hypothetical protein
MGIVTSGIPSEITLALAKISRSRVFIETGTYHGDTTKWASTHFDEVFTIERAINLYQQFTRELSQIPGVKPLLGDSRNVLPKVLEEVGQRKAVVWLDGHWSGGNTAGAGDECPLLDELICLSECGQHIILIDDARLFLCAPPRPHGPAQWPTISAVIEALSHFSRKPFVQIVDDVIFAIPDEVPLKNCLVEYAQTRSEAFWNTFASLQRSAASPGS